MNIHELREAQVRFENRMDEILSNRKPLHNLRSQFVNYFNPKRISTMEINDYVIGVGAAEKGFNFCYALERQLDSLGRMLGATAFKFGVYYGRTKSEENYEYRFTHKFGNTYQEAFLKVRESILNLIEDGDSENLEAIVANPLSPMFKGKILCTYFPDRYLNVFSPDHLNHYLTQLNLDTEELINGDAVFKREALISFKNQDEVMKTWSVDLFAHFLYSEYPGAPPKEENSGGSATDHLKDYRAPLFHSNLKPTFIDLKIIAPPPNQTSIARKPVPPRRNPDYEKEARKLKKLGERGEKLVMDLEKQRLLNAGRKDLALKITRVSLTSDSLGYDILSFDRDGSSKMIEVKATQSDVGLVNFYFTANELNTAQSNENYYVYVVFGVTSKEPKVWPIKNPFRPENKNAIKTPVNFRVTINAIEK